MLLCNLAKIIATSKFKKLLKFSKIVPKHCKMLASFAQSAEMDAEGNVSIRGPSFRVAVPPVATIPIAATNGNNLNFPGENENYSGRFTPILNGRIVFGPQPMRFFATVGLLIFLFLLITYQSVDIVPEFGNGIMLLGFFLGFLMLMTFVTIGLSDPGVIPQNYRLSELISETEGYRERNPGCRFYRYCGQCKGFRPPRSKHCESCDICVRDHETHLLVGGTCVGQRTGRSLLILSLAVGLLSSYLIVVNGILIYKGSMIVANELKDSLAWEHGWRIIVTSGLSLFLGLLMFLTPQFGITLFIFRLYLVVRGYTASSFIHRKNEWNSCALDKRSSLRNLIQFFFFQKRPSVFRKNKKRVGPQSEEDFMIRDYEALLSLPPEEMELLQFWIQLRDQEEFEDVLAADIYNNNAAISNIRSEDEESRRLLNELAASARPKSIPSDPTLHNGDLLSTPLPGQRQKKGLKSKHTDTIHAQLEEFSKAGKLPRSTIQSLKESSREEATLSEGSIPRGQGTQHLISTARAEQLKRLVQLILTRDREGLMAMARVVNVQGLLGLERFDPDNLQFVELSNGLPMITPRHRQPNYNVNVLGGLLGIPQMVAAGLLPPARRLAQDVENSLGQGSIQRIQNRASNHFVYHPIYQQHLSPYARISRPFLTSPMLTIFDNPRSSYRTNERIREYRDARPLTPRFNISGGRNRERGRGSALISEIPPNIQNIDVENPQPIPD